MTLPTFGERSDATGTVQKFSNRDCDDWVELNKNYGQKQIKLRQIKHAAFSDCNSSKVNEIGQVSERISCPSKCLQCHDIELLL